MLVLDLTRPPRRTPCSFGLRNIFAGSHPHDQFRLMKREEVQLLCAKYGIKPSKKYGQNFLIDTRVVRKMCAAAELNAEDFVVEVGPGWGTLTQEISRRVKKMIAVEIDTRMFRVVQELMAMHRNVELVQGDILKYSNRELVKKTKIADRQFLFSSDDSYKVVASLPYSITSALLRKFTEEEPRPVLCVFLVQKEVAERVCAQPGEMSILSVAVQYYGKPEIVVAVPRSAFWPQPEVESAILRITPSPSPSYIKGEKIGVDEKRLFQLVRIGFSSRRKMLKNNIAAGLRLEAPRVQEILQRVGLDPQVRAQVLSVENWIALTHAIWYNRN